jgi:hypothetical protein
MEEMMAKLLVMRLENMKVKHPDQDNSYHCINCLKQVGIYPSGQRAILEHPDIEIICEVCAGSKVWLGEPVPGAIEEAIEQRKKRQQ